MGYWKYPSEYYTYKSIVKQIENQLKQVAKLSEEIMYENEIFIGYSDVLKEHMEPLKEDFYGEIYGKAIDLYKGKCSIAKGLISNFQGINGKISQMVSQQSTRASASLSKYIGLRDAAYSRRRWIDDDD